MCIRDRTWWSSRSTTPLNMPGGRRWRTRRTRTCKVSSWWTRSVAWWTTCRCLTSSLPHLRTWSDDITDQVLRCGSEEDKQRQVVHQASLIVHHVETLQVLVLLVRQRLPPGMFNGVVEREDHQVRRHNAAGHPLRVPEEPGQLRGPGCRDHLQDPAPVLVGEVAQRVDGLVRFHPCQ